MLTGVSRKGGLSSDFRVQSYRTNKDAHTLTLVSYGYGFVRDLTYTHPQALSKKGKRIEDPQIVAWANSKVEGSKIRSFGDPSLSTGVFLLQVRAFTR